MAGHSAPLTLELKRVLPAAPPVVFRCFRDANELPRWWGPNGFTIPTVAFSPRVGEPYRIEMQPRTEERRALHDAGWRDSFDKLERRLADQTA